MFDWLHKTLPKNTFYVLLVKIFHLEKKHVISTPVCLSSLFQERMWLIKGDWVGRNGFVIKRGR